ncbi:MAG: pyridoxal-phosphate dependent enzyme [Gemmatimonadetes bacterium]|nr:pyridoxal-phosphate dependent enzyme [Gemmatimonadota bacterium]
MTSLVDLESVRDAARGLRGVAVRTPLLSAPWLRESAGSEVRLKCEGFQPMGAFKLRGAYTMLARLPEAERARGVITYSSGNHAQAVAFAARAFGVPAVIVMPVNAPAIKVEGTRRLGGEVVQEGTTSEERRALAESIRDDRGMIMIPPFDHPDIIAGQGTVGLEVLEDWPDVETILVPIGGGGLISGVAAAAKALKPGVRVVGVEPVGAPSMRRSLDAGEPVTLDRVESIADGLLPTRVGALTFAHCRDLVDDVVLVEDADIRAAAARLLLRGKLLAEYSGAATTAAIIAAAAARGPTVAVVSGANIDPAHVRDFLTAV